MKNASKIELRPEKLSCYQNIFVLCVKEEIPCENDNIMMKYLVKNNWKKKNEHVFTK